MYIHGHFYNEQNEHIEVHILTLGDRTTEVEIGADGSGLDWTDDPVDITSEVSDTFDVLLRHQASVRLLTKNFVPDFFCSSCRDAVVNIYREGKCLFAGFVEPQTYSQGYNEELDEIELSCIDVLTALRYFSYGNIGKPGLSYASVKMGAKQRNILEILMEILQGSSVTGLDILEGRNPHLYYDGSKAVDSSPENKYSVFCQVSISELLFLGNEEDDVWQQDTVIEELLKYLNLHIVQDGLSFYIFSWESVKGDADIYWRDMSGGDRLPLTRRAVDISTQNVTGTDTTISVGEVYNQILLTCDVKDVSSVIESPLDDGLIGSPFSGKQKYMTEYSSAGEGERSLTSFFNMIKGNTTDFEDATVTTWFLQVMDNKQWTFGAKGMNLVGALSANGTNQHDIPNALASGPGAAIISLGKVEVKAKTDDNSPISKVDMTNYLCISVNGNGKDGESEAWPNADAIRLNIPYAVYNGKTSGGVFSPSDDYTVNYIVISGSVILNPLMTKTGDYADLKAAADTGGNAISPLGPWWHKTVPSRVNGNRYYTQQFFKAERPNVEAEYDAHTQSGFIPFTETGPQEYEFRFSAVGESSDTVSKVGVLQCMLIVGNKCVVEKLPGEDLGTGVPGTGNGQVGDFVWRPYKPIEQCSDEDEYYRQSFSIGFDPKIGDKIVGTRFDLQNNISYTIGVDAMGTAIPIRMSDHVSGRVKFVILGPVNTLWDQYTRRHGTFFRHTSWQSTSVPLLSHVSSIMIKEMEVKLYSDNGQISGGATDKDIVYMSDTREDFVNAKDIGFRISSALTSEECSRLGVANTVKLSAPTHTATGDGVLTIYDHCRGVQAKAEQLYVDSYYKECHAPRIQMVQNLSDTDGGIVDLFAHYRHPALGRTFFVLGISRNLEAGSAEMTLKEME